MTYFLRTLGLIWVLPATLLVWLFYLLPLVALKQIEWAAWDSFAIARFRFVVPFAASKISWYQRLRDGWAGQGLPCAYIYRAQPTPILTLGIWAHEREHSIQWFWFGPLFPIIYGIASLAAMAQGKHPYRDNWMEVDAKLAQWLAVDTATKDRAKKLQTLACAIRTCKHAQKQRQV